MPRPSGCTLLFSKGHVGFGITVGMELSLHGKSPIKRRGTRNIACINGTWSISFRSEVPLTDLKRYESAHILYCTWNEAKNLSWGRLSLFPARSLPLLPFSVYQNARWNPGRYRYCICHWSRYFSLAFPAGTRPPCHPVSLALCKRGCGGRVLFRQVLMTSLQKPKKFLLNSLSIDSATGALSLPSSSQQSVPSDQEAEYSGDKYAAPLCTSLDGEHVYVVYPSEKVSFEGIPTVVSFYVGNCDGIPCWPHTPIHIPMSAGQTIVADSTIGQYAPALLFLIFSDSRLIDSSFALNTGVLLYTTVGTAA